MATASNEIYAASHKLSVLRVALTGGATAALFYLICWIGAFIPNTPGHSYLELFTVADSMSAIGLLQGLCVSFVVGLIVGAIAALVYNALAFLERQ